ncbi:MAG: glycoside hydrolase family 30 beta sandwich domain-containing protein [Bacteroidales bacterium]|jgi:glucosylceramidase
MMRYISVIVLFVLLAGCSKNNTSGTSGPVNLDTMKTDIRAWITNPTNSVFFQQYDKPIFFESGVPQATIIQVDTTITYQTIDGFGNCLTGGSAMLIHKLDQSTRTRLLTELFATDSYNIGISYLRISIGASDLSDHVFTYDDMPVGQTDTSMTNFSLDPESADLIPVLREILAINPDIKILGSPWSAPAWMKTNDSLNGGSLKPQYFNAYAKYFVKYIQGMAAQGINLDAITIQNEPLNESNNPSMYMSAADQASFIKGSLGPAFEAASISTKIIIYDHNADNTSYPLSIYNDPDAARYVDGAAFHLYAGSIDALGQVHNLYPAKNLYFTEQWVEAPGNFTGDISWHIENLIIGATRNWCKNVLEWNMATDPYYEPHTEGGCSDCLGTITLNGGFVVRNPAYFVLAHAAKFVRPGSVRVDSNSPDYLPNVAFVTPSGKKVLIVLNNLVVAYDFNIRFKGKLATTSLPAQSVGTYIW